MPQVVSKPKHLPRLSDRNQKRVGRVSYATGYTSTSDLDPALPTAIGQSDNVSYQPGYLSSSFETSDEEKRMGLNEQKVFQLWERLDQRKDQPINSTPKNTEYTYKSRLNPSSDTETSSLTIRKNLEDKPIEKEIEKDSKLNVFKFMISKDQKVYKVH